MPLIVILAECGIELIPKKIRNHSAVRKNLTTKLYSSQLLDNAIHHSAMINLPNVNKRGRPDITHFCLLNALGSTLNKTGNLKIFIHTIHNKIYELNPEIRITKNFNRFKGLMAKLLIDGSIVTETSKLIYPFEGSLKELTDTVENPEIYLFSINGKLIKSYKDLYVENLSKNYVAIVGGFQKSSFSINIQELSENVISLSQYPLEAWVAINRIITYYELTYGIL
ncbi:MAG: 16S rRNA methyltransferase [Promethearchaeota archaeon]